jgi:hypothetical protein
MTQITGMIKVIFETKQVSEKFAKRDLVVTTDEMYPQDVMMQFTQDKCSVLDNYKEGEQVVVDINIRGREWISPQNESKYFVTLEAWKINNKQNATKIPVGNIEKRFEDEAIDNMTEDDDLPF